jgi:hypothetical protein
MEFWFIGVVSKYLKCALGLGTGGSAVRDAFLQSANTINSTYIKKPRELIPAASQKTVVIRNHIMLLVLSYVSYRLVTLCKAVKRYASPSYSFFHS